MIKTEGLSCFWALKEIDGQFYRPLKMYLQGSDTFNLQPIEKGC